jgi:hypothetical protein
MIESLDKETIFQKPPSAAEILLPPSAKQQLFNMYTERIDEMPGFRQRSFTEAKDDFSATIHEQDDSLPIEETRKLIYNIISPESYAEFTSYLKGYWANHKIEENLESYSYLLLGNHFAFSDIPAEAQAVKDMRQQDPHAGMRNVQVVGKMIPGMEVDLTGEGLFLPVTPLLKYVGRQVQTVPKIPKEASDEAKAQREVWNTEAKHVLHELTTTPGNILFLAGSGTHDIKSSTRLTMQSMNPETAKLLCSPRLKIIPIFFMCDSFSSGKLQPASAKYGILPPRTLSEPDDAYECMQDIARLGSEVAKSEFVGGVEYEGRFKRAGRLLTKHLRGEGNQEATSQY